MYQERVSTHFFIESSTVKFLRTYPHSLSFWRYPCCRNGRTSKCAGSRTTTMASPRFESHLTRSGCPTLCSSTSKFFANIKLYYFHFALASGPAEALDVLQPTPNQKGYKNKLICREYRGAREYGSMIGLESCIAFLVFFVS